MSGGGRGPSDGQRGNHSPGNREQADQPTVGPQVLRREAEAPFKQERGNEDGEQHVRGDGNGAARYSAGRFSSFNSQCLRRFSLAPWAVTASERGRLVSWPALWHTRHRRHVGNARMQWELFLRRSMPPSE